MPDQDPSRLEALRQGVKEAAIGLMGLATLAGGVAVANQLESEPASAANVPEATASDLQQDCGNLATVKPKITNAHITGPRMNHGEPLRYYSMRLALTELPSECNDYIRTTGFKILIGNKSMGPSEAISAGNNESNERVYNILTNRYTGDFSPYHCKKGPGKTSVTAIITPKLRDPQKRKVIKQKTYGYRFKVNAAC